MLDRLKLNNFNSGFEPKVCNKSFVMKTCQRTIVLSYDHNPLEQINDAQIHEYFEGKEAYSYLLEIICGLKSKLVGENEIVGQFKDAYKEYVAQPEKCSRLLQIIEKLFKDAKEVRTKYLLGLSQKTYSSIARKHIVSKHKGDSVLILGSGQLAEDLINQFKKKINVYISARNTERVNELAKLHEITIVPWGDTQTFLDFPFIANSIGFKGVLLDDDFFTQWSQKHERKLFVDLGSPSAIKTDLEYNQGVMKLDDVFGEGAIHENHKKNQIQIARTAMEGIANKRHQIFARKQKNNMNIPNKANLAYV
jgi:glutamyl-tRNA reductase